jgi:hypothetical protein
LNREAESRGFIRGPERHARVPGSLKAGSMGSSDALPASACRSRLPASVESEGTAGVLFFKVDSRSATTFSDFWDKAEAGLR